MTDTTHDDLVKQSILELQDIVRCRCHPAYTGRGLHDPDCECDSAEAVKVVADRIEELERKLAQQDDLVQAAVAAALRGAAEDVRQWGSLYSGLEDVTDEVANDILALITPDAQAALDRVVAAERERIAISDPPTPAQVDDACMSYDHSFGLMDAKQADALRFKAKEWWRCIARAAAIRKGGE